MIKFYQGSYADLNAKGHLFGDRNTEKICFVTDRQVLMMGGLEYGKDGDGLKISDASGYTTAGLRTDAPSDFPSKGCVASTLFYFRGDQSILRYMGADAAVMWQPVQFATLSSADFITSAFSVNEGVITYSARATASGDNYQATIADVQLAVTDLENKISGAYQSPTTNSNSIDYGSVASGINNVVVSVPSGIKRTTYSLDQGNVSAQILDTSLSAVEKSTELDHTLVNAKTLAQVYEDLKSQAVTMKTSDGAGSGFITWTPSTTLAGTEWTPTFHVLTGSEAGALVNNDGTLEVKMAIRQKTTNTGYLATYALFNEAGGEGANAVQLGADINLVKDQFLSNAEYVRAIISGTGYCELTQVTADNLTNVIQILNNAPYNAGVPTTATVEDIQRLSGDNAYGNAFDRYLKLTFALTKTDNEPQDTNADPDSPQTATDTDSIVYINVNELFDCYTGVSGVAVDQTQNKISAVVAPTTEVGYSDDAKGVKGSHYGAVAYLTNSAAGLSVDGIKTDISASIEDLDNLDGAGAPHATTNTWLTDIGVDNGRLTGAYLSAYTSGINFSTIGKVNGESDDTKSRLILTGDALYMPNTTYVTAQDAISALALHIGSLDYTYDGDTGKTMTEFVSYIKQTDGLVVASGHIVKADDLLATEEYTNKFSGYVSGINEDDGKVEYTLTDKGLNLFAINSGVAASGSIQQALSDIVDSTYAAIHNINMARVGKGAGAVNSHIGGTTTKLVPSAATTGGENGNYEPYKIVNTIVQKDGYVAATDLDLVAQTVGFEPITGRKGEGLHYGTNDYEADTTSGYIPVSGYTVGAAISSIANYIGSLDFMEGQGNAFTSGAAPVRGATSGYSIVNTIRQDNGQVTETKINLDDKNVFFSALNGNLPGVGANESVDRITPASGRVAILAAGGNATTEGLGGAGQTGSVYDALSSISNILADYLSFHDASGFII